MHAPPSYATRAASAASGLGPSAAPQVCRSRPGRVSGRRQPRSGPAPVGQIDHSRCRARRSTERRTPCAATSGSGRLDDSRSSRRRRILHDRLMLARARAAREPPSEAAIGRPSAQIRPIDTIDLLGRSRDASRDDGGRRVTTPRLSRPDPLLCRTRWCRLVACRVDSRHPDRVGPKTTDQKVRVRIPSGALTSFAPPLGPTFGRAHFVRSPVGAHLRARSLRSLPSWGPPSGALTSFAPQLGPTFGRASNFVVGQEDSTIRATLGAGSPGSSAQMLAGRVASSRGRRDRQGSEGRAVMSLLDLSPDPPMGFGVGVS